jgi:hypothetical protein
MKGINTYFTWKFGDPIKIRSPCPHSHASRASPSLLLADALPCKKVSFLAEQHMDLPENGVYPHMPILYRENDG